MKKVLALVLSLSLVLIIGIAGTLAWLTSTSDTITNTFTIGKVDITLIETKGDETSTSGTRTFSVSPNTDVEKDPKVTVKSGSDACYLFVKLAKTGNFDTYFTSSVDSGWTPLGGTGNDGVYYRIQAATDADVTYSVLTGDKVTVNDISGFATNDTPTLTFTAYAIQQAGITGADENTRAVAAWNALNS